MDEKRQNFHSQGVQLIGNDINWKYAGDYSTKTMVSDWGHLWAREEYFDVMGRYKLASNVEFFDYASNNDYQDIIRDCNPITEDTFFKITVNIEGEDKIYGMKFKGKSTPKDQQSFYCSWGTTGGLFGQIDQTISAYAYYDFHYFLQLLFNAIKTEEPGTQHNINFTFGNLFDYYEYDGSQYSEIKASYEEATLITSQVANYWTISVKKYDRDIKKASESLFKAFKGSANYNATGDYTEDGYFVGKTIINADYTNFSYVLIEDNFYAGKLKQSYIDYYKDYADVVMLSVVIDLDSLNALNINFVGFAEDSGLNNFVIYKCVTTKTIDGEKVEQEVACDINVI